MNNNTQNVIHIFDKHASDYQDKFMDVNMYGETFDLFCRNIEKENADLLELACGPGNITNYLLNKRPDFKILGTDLSPSMLELAKINNPGAEFKLMDCRDLNKIEKKFDGIMCGFCLPYVSEEEAVKLIADASALLNPKGLIYISTMEENEDAKSGIRTSSHGDKMYMYYHKAVYLRNALLEIILKLWNCSA
jgi:2-polyprenyl-3-methyl-5-hydroxy-6-metoxy-1,4-benzoquinol methylase